MNSAAHALGGGDVLSDGQAAAVYILEVLPGAAVVPGRSDVSGRPRDAIDISLTDVVIS
jgi:hypothetical protein